MLGRGPHGRPGNALGATGVSLLIGIAACLQPQGAFAQEAGTTSAPTTTVGAPTLDHHRVGTGDRDKHSYPASGATSADKAVGTHDHAAGQHADSNHAEQQQQALHAEIQKKFKEFKAALKKTSLAALAEPRHQQRPDAKADPTRGQIRTAVASAADGKQSGNTRILARRHPAAEIIAAPVREASAGAATKPRGSRPLLTTLGGPAPYDPKKGAALSGTTLQHRL